MPTARPNSYSCSSGGGVFAGIAAAVVALPSWVPAPGEVSVLTQANGRLANSFISQCAPNFDPFYFPKTVNAYSGGIVNPWFGQHGAVFFFGGGHSATNDNTVTGLLVAEVCSFFRAVDPSPYFGTGTDSTTRTNNSAGNANSVLDWATGTCTLDGKPVSPHSYGAIDVRAPADGGAAHGSMEIVIIPAMNADNDGSAASMHRIDFNSASTTAGAHSWQRVGTDSIQLANPETGQANAEGTQWAANCWTQLVPIQNRTYIETNNNHSPRWADWETETYERGTGTQRERAPDNPDNGIMFHVPSRDLMVHIERSAGVLRIRTMAVGAGIANPSWSTAIPTLSASIAVPANWTEACWCEDNDRIIVGNVSGVSDGTRYIEIPADLGDPWPVTSHPFGVGQTIDWPVDSYSYKRWGYNPRAKCIVYVPEVSALGDDTVFAYRPVGV